MSDGKNQLLDESGFPTLVATLAAQDVPRTGNMSICNPLQELHHMHTLMRLAGAL